MKKVDLEFYTNLGTQLDATLRVPLYKQISTAFEHSIEAGILKAGEKLPSERSLTALLGVSRCTLRGAFTELTERKFIAPARGMGNFVLGAPALRKLHFISLERYSLDHWRSFPLHYHWLEAGAKEAGIDMHFRYLNTVEELNEVLKAPPELCHGIVLFRPNLEWSQYLAQLDDAVFERCPVPIVLVGRSIHKRGLNTISLDYAEGAKQATLELLQQGHERVGYLGPMADPDGVHLPYFQGFKAALAQYGGEVREEDCFLFVDKAMKRIAPEDVVARVSEFLVKRQFTALMVPILDKPFESILQQLGIVVPDDLSIVSLIEEHLMDGLVMRWHGFSMPSSSLAIRGVRALGEVCRGTSAGGIFEELPLEPVSGATSKPFGPEMAVEWSLGGDFP